MSIDLKDFLQTIQPFKSRNTQPQIIQLNDFKGFAQIIQLFENDPCQNSPNFWENLGNPVAGILQIIEKQISIICGRPKTRRRKVIYVRGKLSSR